MDPVTAFPVQARNHSASLADLRADASTWRLVLAEYLAGLTDQTRRAYAPKIAEFFEWGKNPDGLPPVRTPADITRMHGVAFRAYLERRVGRAGQPLKPSTVALHLTAVSAFVDHCCTPHDTAGNALLASNPLAKVPRPRVEPYSTVRKLAWSDYCKLGALLESDRSLAGLRDYALLLAYSLTGRRREEIARLRGRDFEESPEGRIMYSYVGKGGKARKRELPPPARKAIDRYLRASGRPGLAELADDASIFLSTRGPKVGQALSSDGVLRMLKSRAKQAGVDPKGVLAHGLRHQYAETRYRARMDLQALSRSLDHASIATTGRYLEATTGERDTHWEAHWDLLPFGGGLD